MDPFLSRNPGTTKNNSGISIPRSCALMELAVGGVGEIEFYARVIGHYLNSIAERIERFEKS